MDYVSGYIHWARKYNSALLSRIAIFSKASFNHWIPYSIKMKSRLSDRFFFTLWMVIWEYIDLVATAGAMTHVTLLPSTVLVFNHSTPLKTLYLEAPSVEGLITDASHSLNEMGWLTLCSFMQSGWVRARWLGLEGGGISSDRWFEGAEESDVLPCQHMGCTFTFKTLTSYI